MLVAVLQNSQHHSIDDLDEVLDLVVNASTDQVFVNCGLVLVFVHQLSQSEVDAEFEQFQIDVSQDVLALYALLEQVELAYDLIR